MQRNCEVCNEEFYARPTQIEKGQGKYCSRSCSGQAKTDKSLSRFWTNYDKSGDCWDWRGNTIGYGYGRTKVKGKTVYAHRMAFELHHGQKLEPGEQVLHKCDRPICGNPDHLFVGTQLDNIRDMHQKDRQPALNWKGVRNGRAKLNEDQVREIRRRYATGGITMKQLGIEHGVTLGAIGFIIRRKNWRHVQ